MFSFFTATYRWTPVIFLLLFSCLSISASAQSEEELLQKLSAAKQDSDRISIYIDLHNAVFKKDVAKAERYAQQILQTAKESNNTQRELTGYMALARCQRKNRNYSKVLYYDSLGMQVAKKLNTAVAIYNMDMNTASDYLDAEQPSKALPYLLHGEQVAKGTGNRAGIAKAQNRLGRYYQNLFQPTLAEPYFKKSLGLFEELSDEGMIADTKKPYSEVLTALNKTEMVPQLLFGSIEYYRKTNKVYSLAQCLASLGQYYYNNGFYSKALENFLEAKEDFAKNENEVDIGLLNIDIGGTYLQLRDFTKSLAAAQDAEKILKEVGYETGMPALFTFYGRYYTETNNLQKAENYFKEAAALAKKNNLRDKITDNLRYWAILKRKLKDNTGADSMQMNYAERIVKERDQSVVLNELKENISRNKIKDTTAIKLLSLMYAPGGVELLKQKLGMQSLSSLVSFDSTSIENTFLTGTAGQEKQNEFNRQLLNVETQYKTRLIRDSLALEKNTNLLAAQQAKNNRMVLWLIAGLCLLLAVGLWLQVRNRRRAVRDKNKIQLLQNEIHHRVKNNLGVISRLVDVAGKNVSENIPLSTLKNRIKSIELLHKHLYSQKAETGKISLNDYVTELCKAIGDTFESEDNIQLHVNAEGEVTQDVAEKLGLIINELVTNAYKYAFANTAQGNIEVAVQPAENASIKVKVKDNGAGMLGNEKKGYGTQLIKGLTHELGGKGSFSFENGTSYEMVFPAA